MSKAPIKKAAMPFAAFPEKIGIAHPTHPRHAQGAFSRKHGSNNIVALSFEVHRHVHMQTVALLLVHTPPHPAPCCTGSTQLNPPLSALGRPLGTRAHHSAAAFRTLHAPIIGLRSEAPTHSVVGTSGSNPSPRLPLGLNPYFSRPDCPICCNLEAGARGIASTYFICCVHSGVMDLPLVAHYTLCPMCPIAPKVAGALWWEIWGLVRGKNACGGACKVKRKTKKSLCWNPIKAFGLLQPTWLRSKQDGGD